jgi:hypothetical protein
MRILRFGELFTRYYQLRLNSADIGDLNSRNVLANIAEREFAERLPMALFSISRTFLGSLP